MMAPSVDRKVIAVSHRNERDLIRILQAPPQVQYGIIVECAFEIEQGQKG